MTPMERYFVSLLIYQIFRQKAAIDSDLFSMSFCQMDSDFSAMVISVQEMMGTMFIHSLERREEGKC